MPITFAPTPPGVLGDAQRVARGPHAVRLSGDALQMLAMLPSFMMVSAVAPPPNPDGARMAPYAMLAWLMMPAMRVDRDDLPLQAFLFRFLVSPAKMGAAFAACIVAGLDVSPCTPGLPLPAGSRHASGSRLPRSVRSGGA